MLVSVVCATRVACESPLRWGLIVLLWVAADAETLCGARQAARIEATRTDLP